MADSDTIEYPSLTTLTRAEIERLADRLLSHGISTISISSRAERDDLILASRCLRRLLSAFEKSTGRELSALMIVGGC
jgi:hypothetical protein